MVASEVYHCHPDELTQEQGLYLLEIIAARIEQRRREKAELEKK